MLTVNVWINLVCAQDYIIYVFIDLYVTFFRPYVCPPSVRSLFRSGERACVRAIVRRSCVQAFFRSFFHAYVRSFGCSLAH